MQCPCGLAPPPAPHHHPSSPPQPLYGWCLGWCLGALVGASVPWLVPWLEPFSREVSHGWEWDQGFHHHSKIILLILFLCWPNTSPSPSVSPLIAGSAGSSTCCHTSLIMSSQKPQSPPILVCWLDSRCITSPPMPKTTGAMSGQSSAMLTRWNLRTPTSHALLLLIKGHIAS